MEQKIKNQSRRCPRLGSPVSFSYCMECGDTDLPCWKVIDCWWEFFDINSYLQQQLSETDYQKLVNQKPPNKVTSILELIEKAKNR